MQETAIIVFFARSEKLKVNDLRAQIMRTIWGMCGDAPVSCAFVEWVRPFKILREVFMSDTQQMADLPLDTH